MLFVSCLTSQQHASVSQGRICEDNCTCCHTEIEATNSTFCLTQSQYTDTGPTRPSVNPATPDAWQDNHWTANFEVAGMTRPGRKSRRKRDSNQTEGEGAESKRPENKFLCTVVFVALHWSSQLAVCKP